MWFLQEVSLQCLNMHIAVAPCWSLENNKKLSPCLSRIPSAAAGPVLVPFSINFTIINLEFEEEMGHPGSRKFNIMDRTLQSLVRVPLSASSPTYWPCPALLLEEATAHLILTIHTQIQLTMPALLSSLLSWLYSSLLLFTFLLSPQFRPLFSKTSVGPLYSGCKLTLLRWVFSRLELLKVLSVQGLCSDSSPHFWMSYAQVNLGGPISSTKMSPDSTICPTIHQQIGTPSALPFWISSFFSLLRNKWTFPMNFEVAPHNFS